MDRRAALRALLAAAAALPLAAACGRRRSSPMTTSPAPTSTSSMPVIFLAHGAPMLLDDAPWVGELARWAAALPRPSAILMVSAHWERRPVTLGATTTVPLVYDFYGFPERYYRVTYPAPGAPALAERVRALLAPEPVADEPRRGLDHGAYVPLIAMYPDADLPVLQMSLPTLEPGALFALGRALAPLRREGVLVVGSGFLTHNLGTMDFRPGAPVPSWAAEMDAWCGDVLARRDIDALLSYRERAPGVRIALPTHEHFVPVIVAAGAAADDPGPVTFPITGFAYGSGAKRSVQLG